MEPDGNKNSPNHRKRLIFSSEDDSCPPSKRPASDPDIRTPDQPSSSSNPDASTGASHQGSPETTPNKTSPSKFSPMKLSSPFKALSKEHNIVDGGADYSKPCTSSQCSPRKVEEEFEDPDLQFLNQDLYLDPDFSTELLSQGHGTEPADWFAAMPMEIMENIFCRLPVLDLCLHMTSVCSRWNQIISDDAFLYWKKTYFRILRGSPEHKQLILDKMADGELNPKDKASLLPGLIRFMADFKPETSRNMTECLQRHPKYQWATALLHKRITKPTMTHNPNPWSVVAAVVVLSEDVDDILRILVSLLKPPSQCTGKEVIECLYCIATYLLVFRSLQYQECWTGMHYRVFYALYLYENSAAVIPEANPELPYRTDTCLPNAPTSGLKYTQEQLRICNHRVQPGDVVKIIAFAGTGKTSTLIRYTQLRPQTKFLLIVFNKSTRIDCNKRFPGNVICTTTHSLAWNSDVIQKYHHQFPNSKKKSKIGKIYVGDIIHHFPHRKGENYYTQAKFVLDTLEAFMCSDDQEMTHRHVPFSTRNNDGNMEYIGEERRANVLDDALQIWRKAINPKDRLCLPHDGYLKLYQLSQPVIDNYDVILIDEAQDQTPAVINVLKSQQQAKILVGDPNQQIYSFRGAVNAMDLFPASTVFYLTQSFRFGSNIAYVANACLEVLKGTGHKILVGNSSKGFINGRRVGQLAILTRTNFTLFKEAVRKCSYTDKDIKVAISGGVQGFGFATIRNIYFLYKNEPHRIDCDFIKRFKSMADLERYATNMSDHELGSKIKIVLAYQHQVWDHMKRIEAKCVPNLEDADLVLSTAHKAKGLEFSTVRITEDFLEEFIPAGPTTSNHPLLQCAGPTKPVARDELNVLYVAVTRAKRALQLTRTLMRVLHFAGEKFRVPRLSSSLPAPHTCVLTGMNFDPCALTLQRSNMTLGNGTSLPSGVYSPQVVSEDLPAFSRLFGLETDPPPGEITERTSREPDWAPQQSVVLPAAILGAVMDWPGFRDDHDEFDGLVDINLL